MEKKQYLSEEKYQKIKKILIIIGCISLMIGICLLISSFFVKVPKMSSDGWYEAETKHSLLLFLSIPFGLMIPFAVFSIAFRREIMAFTAQQTMPVAQEGIEKMAPSAGVAAKEIAKGIKEGLEDDK